MSNIEEGKEKETSIIAEREQIMKLNLKEIYSIDTELNYKNKIFIVFGNKYILDETPTFNIAENIKQYKDKPNQKFFEEMSIDYNIENLKQLVRVPRSPDA